MDYMKHTLQIEGAGREEAEAIRAVLEREGLCGREGAFETYAFDPGFEVCPYGIQFWSAGEAQADPDGALRDLSASYPEALFVYDSIGHEEDCGRTYFRGGRSHDAERVVSYTPFDEAELR